MPENAARRIKKVFTSLLVFGTLLFTLVSPVLADSPTIIHGHVDKRLAGYNIGIICRYLPANYEDIPPGAWNTPITGEKAAKVDSDGNYSVNFTKSQCDIGEYVLMGNYLEFVEQECASHYCFPEVSPAFWVDDSRNTTADFELEPMKTVFGVPEYNPLTFILAAVGSFGLFLYFRKRNKNPLLQYSN